MNSIVLKEKLALIRSRGLHEYTKRQNQELQRQTLNAQIQGTEATMILLDGQEVLLQELLAEQEEFERVDRENQNGK